MLSHGELQLSPLLLLLWRTAQRTAMEELN